MPNVIIKYSCLAGEFPDARRRLDGSCHRLETWICKAQVALLLRTRALDELVPSDQFNDYGLSVHPSRYGHPAL